MKKKKTTIRDPVCMKKMNKKTAHQIVEYKGKVYYLCCPLCYSVFMKNIEEYVQTYEEINI